MKDPRGRKSTSGAEWRKLIDAVGSVGEVCKALGMPQTTFYRASRGLVRWPEDKLESLANLCEIYEVEDPLKHGRIARQKDLTPLRLLGEALSRGFPAARRTVKELRDEFPEEQLLELAESENTPETILRAITVLLEGT